MAGLVSPFAGSVVGGGLTENEDVFEQLFNELEDESFDDAVSTLVDEAAALQLSSPWAAESGSGVERLQAWGARVDRRCRSSARALRELLRRPHDRIDHRGRDRPCRCPVRRRPGQSCHRAVVRWPG